MKNFIAPVLFVGLVACGKTESTAPAPPTGSAAAAPATTSAATASAAPSAAASAAPSAAASAAPAAAQKGLKPGEVAVGYLQDSKDEGQCAVLAVPEAEKAKYNEAKVAEAAKMLKAKVVASCPTEKVVGTCLAMGMLVNYSAPKYDVESAKKDCKGDHGKWVD